MDALVECVDRLVHAETSSMVVRLELSNHKYELQYIDVPALREALTDAQDAYESELDVLSNILNLFRPTRYRRGVIDVDKRIGRALRDVLNAKAEKESAFNRWIRGSRRAANLRNLITTAEAELVSLEKVEQLVREDCYAPIVELARVWTNSRPRVISRG